MKRILIITPSWIGDTVAAQPLFMRLHERFPDALIDALAPPWVAAVLEAMPEINGQVIVNPFAHGELHITARWRLARELATHLYDAAWILPNSLKSALIPFLAGIPQRVGFTGEMRYGLVNVRHTLDELILPLQVERYAALAATPRAPLQRPLPTPRLHIDARHRETCLQSLGLSASPAPVVFCPGAEYGPAKRWPETHFAELARLLGAKGIPVWLLGSKKDAPVGEDIAQQSQGAARNLCGVTSLADALHLISVARHVVTNDSGLMHVAAALDVPLTALFGSSSPGYTPPLSDKARIISLKLECSPCYKRECPLGHLKCLREISPTQVANTIFNTSV